MIDLSHYRIEIRADPAPMGVEAWDGEAYRESVLACMEPLVRSRVGSRVLAFLRGHDPHRVTIVPGHRWERGQARTSSEHPPDGYALGSPTQLEAIHGRGTGRPASARIELTPYFFRRYSSTADPERHTGTFGDSVLLHELVHAMRCLHGCMDSMPMTGDYAGYGVFEELCGVLVENMYSSERQRPLAGGYREGLVRDHLMWPWWEASSHPEIERERAFTRRFAEQMPAFASVMAAIPETVCFCNPFRWLSEPGSYLHVTRDTQRR